MEVRVREEDYLLRFLISFISQVAKIIIIDPLSESAKDKLIKSISVKPDSVCSINNRTENITDEIASQIYNYKK